MEEKIICEFCGEVLDEDSMHYFDDTIMCQDCYEERTCVCDCCNDTIWNEDNVGDSNITLCQACYDRHYGTCDCCGTVIYNDDIFYDDDDDHAYCQRCYEEHILNSSIKNYSYKPDPIFYGECQPHYGIEIEIDGGGENHDNAKTLLNIGNKDNEHIYIKHDGSLDDGMEIVSHPMTINYHLNNMCWYDIFSKALLLGYTSHQAKTCGLHIHINRSALGKSIEEQENTIGRILYFYEKFWTEILKFSRRTEYQANRWASRYGGVLVNPKESLKSAKTAGLGRYVAVNLENHFTVEFRIFRGTLKYSTFAATLQFTDMLVSKAKSLSDEEFQTMTWDDFISSIGADKRNLIEYLKTRKLYINEREEM